MINKPILIISLFTVACILVIWAFVPSTLVFSGVKDDYARVYAPVAYNLIDGKGYTLNGKISLEYPPGFPLLLAAVFYTGNKLHIPETVALNVVKLLLMVSANICILLISLLYWKGKRAILASVFWITYPLILWIPCQRNSELLFLPVFYAAVYFLLRLHNRSQTKHQATVFALCSGALFGCASLVRPIALFIPLFLSLFYLALGKKELSYKLINSLCLLAASILAILPWETWVYKNNGKLILLSSRDAISIYDGLTFDKSGTDSREGVNLPHDVKYFMQDIAINGSTVYKTKRDILNKVFLKFRSSPWTVIKLYMIKTFRVWYGTNSNRFEDKIFLIQLFYIAFWLLVLIKIRKNRDLWKNSLYVLSMIVYFWGISVVILSIVRYMVPVLGLLFVFSPAILEYGPVKSLCTNTIELLGQGKRYNKDIVYEK